MEFKVEHLYLRKSNENSHTIFIHFQIFRLKKRLRDAQYYIFRWIYG